MEFYFSIAKEVIRIQYKSPYVGDYLAKEFSLLACDPLDATISIIINEGKPGLEGIDIKDNNDYLTLSGNTILQHLSAFQREFWAKYIIEKDTYIVELFIPYENGGLVKRFFSPYFENPFQSCLTDFFHNTFISLLQYTLFKKKASLFHGSAFAFDDKHVIILSGGAQSGKSSLMSIIAKNHHVRIYSEDFAFLSSDGIIYGYPHQARVKFKDMETEGVRYKYGDGNCFQMLLDKTNRSVYSILTKNNNARRFPIKEVFYGSEFTKSEKVENNVFLLKRGGSEVKLENIKNDDYCAIMTNIILSEFHNMKGAMDLFSLLYKMEGNDDVDAFLYNTVFNIYEKGLNGINIREISLPYYPNIEIAARELIKICFKK